MAAVVDWTRIYHDELIECLLCLMIFFSHDDEGRDNINEIQQSWKSVLYRYIQTLAISEERKTQLFSGALHLTNLFNGVNDSRFVM